MGTMGEKCQLHELLENFSYSETDIERIIKAFDYFINISNKDYRYNQAYLNKYIMPFVENIQFVNMKYKIFHSTMTVLPYMLKEELLENEKIEVIVDNFYIGELKNGKIKLTQKPFLDVKRFNSSETCIKCIYYKNGSKYKVESKRKFIKSNSIDINELGEIQNKFAKFINSVRERVK